MTNNVPIKTIREACNVLDKAFIATLDDDDRIAIEEAMLKRESWDVMPHDSQSCERGALLAEICRGWLERVEHDKPPRDGRLMNAPATTHRKGVTAVDTTTTCTFIDDQGITWCGAVVAKARHDDDTTLRLVRTESDRFFWVPFERLNWEQTR